MLKILFLMLSLGGVAYAESPSVVNGPSVIFRAEFGKSEAYEGEQLLCTFVLYSQEDVLDIEVVKFPEFRGFWSENVSLHQGPLPLGIDGLSGSPGPDWKKVVVGAYLVSSMVGQDAPRLEPMKISVRRPNAPVPDASEGNVALSAYQPLKINKLPPLPHEIDARFFPKAVGHFSFQVETPEVSFEKEAPIVIRMGLQGEGNFQEINEIKIPDLKELEILSQRAYAQGTGQTNRKVFEITASVHSDRSLSIPSFPFVYFDPALGRYQTIMTSPIALTFVPGAPPSSEESAAPLFYRPADQTVSDYRPLASSPGFWWVQIIIGFTFLAFVAGIAIPDYLALRERRPEYRRLKKLEEAESQLEAGNVARFLQIADILAMEMITERASLPSGITRQKALELASRQLDANLLDHVRALFQAHELLSYSPTAERPPDLASLRRSLHLVLGLSGQKKPRA